MGVRHVVSLVHVLLLLLCWTKLAHTKGCIFSRFSDQPHSHPHGKWDYTDVEPSARRLLQASNCTLTISNQVQSFSGCHDYSQALGSDLKLYYTILNGSDGGNMTLRGALDGARTAGQIDWIGFGFNQDLEMIGGNAIIVRTCSTCSTGASINDYYLSDEAASGVNPPSHLQVPFKDAALSNGRLQGVFEISMPSASVNNIGTIYAAGPLSSSGQLEQHTYYSSELLDMSSGVVASLGPALAPLAAAAPSPASSPTVSSGTPAQAPAPAVQGCVMDFAGNNSRITFANCQSLTTATTASSGFRLLWNIAQGPAGNGSVLTAGMEISQGNAWAGYGFPATAGQMLGANAIIVHPCSTCPTGAQGDRYLLQSYDTSGVQANTGSLVLSQIDAAAKQGGGVQALFTLSLPQTPQSLSSQPVIAAVGPWSQNALREHPTSNAYTGTVNLASGAIAAGGEATGGGGGGRRPVIHGILMIVGWGLLLPLGVVFARCKEWGNIWFQLHRATQVLGYAAGAAGAGLGWSLHRPNGTDLEQNHRIIGWTVWLLLTIQMLALFWRPAPKANKLRYSWNAFHWAGGSSSVLLAFANVFIGLHISSIPARWAGLYALAFALILILWLSKLGYNVLVLNKRRRKRQPLTKNPMSAPSSDSGNSSSESGAQKV